LKYYVLVRLFNDAFSAAYIYVASNGKIIINDQVRQLDEELNPGLLKYEAVVVTNVDNILSLDVYQREKETGV